MNTIRFQTDPVLEKEINELLCEPGPQTKVNLKEKHTPLVTRFEYWLLNREFDGPGVLGLGKVVQLGRIIRDKVTS